MAMNLTTQASLLATIKDVMSYKGSKTTYQEILDLTDMVKGDIWGCTEVGHLGFFLYNGTDWELFGSDSTKAVTLDSEQTITGLKTFDTTPIITNEAKSELEATNLKSVNTVVNNSIGWLIPDGDWTSMYMKWSTDGDRYGGGTLSDVYFITKEVEVSQNLLVNGQEENILIPLIAGPGLSSGKLGGTYPGLVVLMPVNMIKPYALPGVELKMSNMTKQTPVYYNQICVDFYKEFPYAVTTDYSKDDIKTWLANKGITNYILIVAYVNNVYVGANPRFYGHTAFWRFGTSSSIFGRSSATVVDMYIEKVGKVPCPIYDITYSPNCWCNSLDYNTVTTLVEMNYTKSDGTQVDVVTSAASKSLRTGNQYQLRMGAGDGVFTPPLISMKDSPLAPDYVTLNTEQTITKLKTFDVLPQSSTTPANDADLVTKTYVDTQIANIDTSNLAKLDQSNTFTGENVFTGSVGIQTFIPLTNPTVANPKEWATLVDNDIPTKKQIVDNIQVDTSNLAKLNSDNTFTANQTFDNVTINGNVSMNGKLIASDVDFYGSSTFYSNTFFKSSLVVANNNANQELAITPTSNGVSINLGDDCTLTMNARIISELKRLLGIS